MYLLAHLVAPAVPVLLLRALRPRARAARLPPLWLAVGGILPDLVDKPLGHLVLGYGHGRLWMHSLLALAGLAALAILAARLDSRAGLVAVAVVLGVASHLVLDSMWASPVILLWPLLGPMPHRHYDPSLYLTAILRPEILRAEGLAAAALLGTFLAGRPWRRPRSRKAAAAEPDGHG